MPDVMPDISDIIAYFHCKTCLEEIPEGVSPAEWSDQQAGWTMYGLQVWCNRHNKNIIGLEFNEVANQITLRKQEEEE